MQRWNRRAAASLMGVFALAAAPALAQKGTWQVLLEQGMPRGVPHSLWTVVGLGMVLVLAYGVSWLIVRPVVGRGQVEAHLERARAENEDMKAALDQMPERVLLLDETGRIAWANHRMLRLLSGVELLPGREPGEVLGSAAVREAVARVLRSGGAVAEYVCTTRTFPRELKLRVLPLGEGGGALALFGEAAASASNPHSRFKVGPLEIDPPSHKVWLEGRPLELTAMEFRLLIHLVEHRDQVQTRAELLHSVWGYEHHTYTRTVDTHIRRLRAKLGAASAMVETIRGAGYRFRTEGA